jgi:hypothetical protein
MPHQRPSTSTIFIQSASCMARFSRRDGLGALRTIARRPLLRSRQRRARGHFREPPRAPRQPSSARATTDRRASHHPTTTKSRIGLTAREAPRHDLSHRHIHLCVLAAGTGRRRGARRPARSPSLQGSARPSSTIPIPYLSVLACVERSDDEGPGWRRAPPPSSRVRVRDSPASEAPLVDVGPVNTHAPRLMHVPRRHCCWEVWRHDVHAPAPRSLRLYARARSPSPPSSPLSRATRASLSPVSSSGSRKPRSSSSRAARPSS